MIDHSAPTIIAQRSVGKCWLVIAMPAIILFLSAVGLIAKGYPLSDYPMLVKSGELHWPKQLVGFACLGLWTVLYSRRAVVALKDGAGPVLVDDEGMLTVGPSQVGDIGRLKDFRVSYGNWFPTLTAVGDQGRSNLGPVMFLTKQPERIAAELNALSSEQS